EQAVELPAFVFVWVKNVGRRRHQPITSVRDAVALGASDRVPISCQLLPLGLGRDPGVPVDVSTAEPTPQRAEEVHGLILDANPARPHRLGPGSGMSSERHPLSRPRRMGPSKVWPI